MYLHTLCQVTLYINVHYIIMCKIKVLLDCLYVYKVLAGLDNVESTKKNNLKFIATNIFLLHWGLDCLRPFTYHIMFIDNVSADGRAIAHILTVFIRVSSPFLA